MAGTFDGSSVGFESDKADKYRWYKVDSLTWASIEWFDIESVVNMKKTLIGKDQAGGFGIKKE